MGEGCELTIFVCRWLRADEKRYIQHAVLTVDYIAGRMAGESWRGISITTRTAMTSFLTSFLGSADRVRHRHRIRHPINLGIKCHVAEAASCWRLSLDVRALLSLAERSSLGKQLEVPAEALANNHSLATLSYSPDMSKFSIAVGGSSGSSSAPSSGMSNMERLLAQAKNKPAPVAAKKAAPARPSNPFGDDDDDDEPSRPPPSLAGPSRPKPSTMPKINQKVSMSRAEKKAQEEALKMDASVFDYDGVYDGMKAAEQKLEQAKKVESEERKPKYIESFLASAQTRRLDRLRAEEKMLQIEREKEGDQFVDKEKFVTEAYKKQMEEVRKAEEEEKEREGKSHSRKVDEESSCLCLDALRKSKKGPGLTSFYKTMLDDDAERHAAAMAAANGSGLSASGPSLAIRPPIKEEYEPEAEYDPFLARQAASSSKSTSGPSGDRPTDDDVDSKGDSGKNVDINDDGEVVDKRSLLRAGLNIMNKPKAELPNSLLTSQQSGNKLDGPYKSRAVGTAATYQERMERERRRLADQMREEAERKKAAEEARLREEEEAARRRREGDDGEAQRKREEAKERFMARKRAREEAEQEAKKKKKEEQ